MATELASSTAQERFLGYRTSEYIAFAIEKDSLFEWVLGEGLGRAESLRYLGTKGDIYHSGYYHNYLLTITESLGLIGGVLLCMILPSSKAKFGDLNLRAIWISWLVICCIEAPRDGAWPLFFISALGANREEKREIALKSGW